MHGPAAMETHMLRKARFAALAAFCTLGLAVLSISPAQADSANGVVCVKSAYGLAETIRRLKADIADKKIRFFAEIDQATLAKEAGIALRPSTLLIFGNPPLGTQFLTSNPDAGLDWPVRVLVQQDQSGAVWAVYTDFDWIARRYAIADREAQFKMASTVIASITSSVAAP
jgi:uncharacterized protein (DUF302 family)